MQFIPGELGRERAEARPDSPRAFRTRTIGGVDEAWGQANRLTKPLAFAHALESVFPPALVSTHPEFFPLVQGQRLQPPVGASAFWNPDLGRADVAERAATAAADYFRTHAAASSFALGVNDGLVFGESPETRALVLPVRWFRGRPDYSPLVFTFMNRAAEDLQRTYPDKYLGCLAYYWCENAPPFPLQRQVVPFLTADRAQGYDQGWWDEEMALQEKWGARAGERGAADGTRRLGLYDYLYGAGYLVPRVYPHLLAAHLRHARQAGFTDYFAECEPNWGLDGPMPWLTAQLLQDPERSVDALLDEYYRSYFQEAATPMRKFFERCEALWLGQPKPAYWLKHFRNESQVVIFPATACAELRAFLDEARRAARTSKVTQRVELASLAFGVTERLVQLCATRDRLVRELLDERADEATLRRHAADYAAARREFVRYTYDLRHTQPLAIAKFKWQDYLNNDPTLVASQRLSSATTPTREILRNPNFAGEKQPARVIADLRYSAALPAEWLSKVEPAQFQVAELRDTPTGRVLRFEGNKTTQLSQWNVLAGPGTYRASVAVRGHVSPGTVVALTFAWLDNQDRHLGFTMMRLPDGEWNDWVTLRQVGAPPAGAVWVGMGIQVQNQIEGDWIEAKNFSLQHGREVPQNQ